MVDLIKLDPNSIVPKYLQIIDAIVYNISSGNIKIVYKTLLVNTLSKETCLSRDTVERANSVLQKHKVLVSFHGKGTYVAETGLITNPKILFLVNKLSPYKIKAWVDATPNDFIQEIRLNHAEKLVEINKLSISKVSYKLGFKRSKYFSQCFKKKY